MTGRLARRLHPLGAVSLAALLAAGLAATPAFADPAGTVVLASGASAVPELPSLFGTAGSSVVVGRADGIYAVPKAGGAAVKLTSSTTLDAVGGNYLWFGSGSTPTWIDVDNPADTGAVPGNWMVPTPTGGAFVGSDTSPNDVFTQTTAQAGTATATDLGTLPASAPNPVQLFGGPNGVVVDSYDPNASGPDSWTYFPYAATGPVALDASGLGYLSCQSVSATAVGCVNGTSVIWLPLSGSAAVTTTAAQVNAVVVTDTTLAYTTSLDAQLHSVPAAGGTVSTLTSPKLSPRSDYQLAADGTNVYFATDGNLGTAGIAATPDAATTPTAVATDGNAPLRSFNIALTAGRAAWTDNRQANHPVWSRSLTNANGITAGAQSLVATNATFYGLSISATRTAYSSGNAVFVKRGTVSTKLTDVVPLDPYLLSGTRIAYFANSGKYRVRNLVTGTTTSLSLTHVPADRQQLSLFGNYVAYVKPDGSVWRKDLTTTAAPVKLAGALSHFQFGYVVTWGDWVAWSRWTASGARNGFRNARTMSAITTLPTTINVVSASVGGFTYQTSSGAYRYRRWTNSTTYALPSSHRAVLWIYSDTGIAPPEVSGSRMAWIGADGRPRVAPLPVHVADRPRSLGNARARHALQLGATWSFDLVTSATLSQCAVKIQNSSGKTIRTLSCAKAAAQQGEIEASWDGKNASGHRVRAGSYTWLVAAGNSDGALVNANGSTHPTKGTIEVSS